MADKTPVTTKSPARPSRFAEPINWLRKEVDRVFDDLVQRPDRLFDFGPGMLRLPSFPLMKIREEASQYKITADVPGFEQDQISVSLSDGVLVISGEADDTVKSEEDGLIIEERHRGSFERHIPLPGAIASDGVKAKLRHGVLKISVPKAKTASAKSITVEMAD